MARANRLRVDGGVFHLTQRCHNRAFVLKFARDRDAYRAKAREHLRQFDVGVARGGDRLRPRNGPEKRLQGHKMRWFSAYLFPMQRAVCAIVSSKAMMKVDRMLRAHQELILNWFRAKGEISSGAAVEGLNNKIRVVTRMSY